MVDDEVLTTSGECSKLQQNNNDESDFCPLVIDTSLDSESESGTILGLRIQRTTGPTVVGKRPSLHPEHMMPLPNSPSSYPATLPSDDTMADYTRNCCSSASSNDSQSMKNVSQLSSHDSPTKEIGGNKSHGKGSAPCKTRRKGDRILPVEVDETGSEKFLCPICSDVLLTASDLTKHIRSHNTSTANPNSCTICGKVLSSQSSLDRHMLVHSGERPFQCRVCQMSFTTNGNMHRHMRIHEKELAANMSGGAGSLPKSMSSQMRNHKQLDHIVNACMPLSQMKSWQTSKRKHNGDAENETPKKRQAVSQALPILAENSHPLVSSNSRGHSVQIKQPPKEKTDSTWPCTTCNKKFLCVYGLESHMSDSHAELGAFCGLCYQAFATVNDLQNHKIGVHSQTSAAVTERRMEATHNPIPIGFHNLDYMDFSSETFVNTARVWCEKNQQQSSSTSHDFTCDHCHHAFPTAGTLQLHMDTHSPQATSTCTKCDCTFGSLAAYRSHMARHVSNDVIARYTKIIGANDNDLQDCISKQEFMMVLGLQVNNSIVTKGTSYRDLNVNSVYFEMLPTMSADKGKPVVLSLTAANPSLKLALQDKKELTKSNALLEHLQAPLTKGPQTRGMSLMLTTPKLSDAEPAQKIFPSQNGRPDVTPVSRMTPEMNFIKQEPIDDGLLNDAASYSLNSSTFAKEKLDSFVCRFCDEIFSTERLLKAHERSHLGLSPYQCSMCKYSSTDKSTLVRHLRTHNGEHPFQCRICNSVFTTKANCERHVRKRHCKEAKADIEALVTYNQFITDNTQNQEAFASPDTVCKYCGEDFRYFRALKHHLRCHNSCRYKPFVCILCSMGFSMKANCIRHIQKQHLDVEHNQIEEHIQVNDATDIFHNASDEQRRDGDESIPCSTPINQSLWSRKRPLESPIAGFDGAGPLPDSHYPTYITSPPVPVLTKVKYSDSGFDQPLDFSMKASLKQEDISEHDVDMEPPIDEVPIDLSVRKQEKCKNPIALYPTADGKVPTHLLHSTAHLSHLDESHNRVEFKYDPDTSRDGEPSSEMCTNSTRNFHSQLPFTKETILAANSAYNSDSELASITKILDTTDAARFRNFFSDQRDTSPKNRSDCKIKKAQFISVLANGSPNARLDASEQNCESPRSEISEGMLPMLLPTDLGSMQFVEDGEWEQRKKKRNSYSELPHKLQCPFCPRAFPWISSLNRHILTHTGQKPFKCPQCPVTFSTKSNRERHMVRKHGLDIHDPATRQMMDRPFKCHLCVFSSFSTAGNLMKHYKDRHPEREMPQQLASSLTACFSVNGTEHIIDMTDSLSTASDVSSKSTTALNMSNIQIEDDEHCHISLDLTSGLKDHNDQTSASTSISDPPTPTSNVNPSPQNSSVTPPPTADNTRHVNPERDNYNVDKITECWKCGVTYESRKNLLRHLKEHSIDLPFKCYLCDASFSSRLESLEHKVSRHSVDWDMISEKNKVENIKEFARAQEGLVQQTLAGKVLKDAEDGEDSRIDTDYAQRKVYCSLCIKRFWSLQDLRRHMRSHTGERPFECDVCQARFTLKHSMMRHRRKHCDADIGNAASDDDNSTHTEENADTPNMMNVNFTTQQLADDDQEETNTEAGGDLLHNLLGVETSAIDQILNSADDAAALLGINKITTAN